MGQKSQSTIKTGKILLYKVGMIVPVWWYSSGELNSVKRVFGPVPPSPTFRPSNPLSLYPFPPSIHLSCHLSIYPSPFFPLPFLHKSPFILCSLLLLPIHPFPSFPLPAPLPNKPPLHSSTYIPPIHPSLHPPSTEGSCFGTLGLEIILRTLL